MEEILRRGHELAHHSYTHAWILSLLRPSRSARRWRRVSSRSSGSAASAPRGWRSPAAEISAITMPMLVEYGFDYSSNFFDDDSPYLHDRRGQGDEDRRIALPLGAR